jgi:hypothetical protein
MGGGISRDTSVRDSIDKDVSIMYLEKEENRKEKIEEIHTLATKNYDEIIKNYARHYDWPSADVCARFTSPGDGLGSWDFNIWKINHSDLPVLCSAIVLYHSLPQKFNIKYEKWCGLYRQVEINMSISINPYHNFLHIIDVMQTCAAFLAEMGASKILHDQDILSLYLSAFLHDIGHPGLNNVYQINAETPLALVYNDKSVLENHHCALAFEIFKLPSANIFVDVPSAFRKSVRKSMIEMILSTDMMTHFTLRDELDDCIKRNFNPLNRLQKKAPIELVDKDRTTILRSILHAADISNPAKTWETSKRWSDLVIEEFFAQGDLEKTQHLPLSMNMDRLTGFQDEISLNFCDFIVAPFFFTLAEAFPKLEKAICYLETNRIQWDALLRSRIGETKELNDAQRIDILTKWTEKDVKFKKEVKAVLQSISRASLPLGSIDTRSRSIESSKVDASSIESLSKSRSIDRSKVNSRSLDSSKTDARSIDPTEVVHSIIA